MFVSAAAFNNGKLSWRVLHDSQKAQDHLIVEGNPPEGFGPIRDQELARVDSDREIDFIFEIPIRIAQELVGFRHDGGPELEFHVLREAEAGPKSSWKFWKK